MNDDTDLRRTALRIAGAVLIILALGGMAAALLNPTQGNAILDKVVTPIATILGGLVGWALRGRMGSR